MLAKKPDPSQLGRKSKKGDKIPDPFSTGPFLKDDRSTWKAIFDLYPLHGIIFKHFAVAHCQFVWDVRQNRKVAEPFAKIHGCNTEDLLVSFGPGASLHLPPEQTNKYSKDLNAEMNSIDLLKILLRVISDIKDISMDMEFKIVEVQENFRILNMYDYEIEPEIQQEVDLLMTNWEELIDFADRRNFEVNDFKQTYSTVTKEEVKNFQQ